MLRPCGVAGPLPLVGGGGKLRRNPRIKFELLAPSRPRTLFPPHPGGMALPRVEDGRKLLRVRWCNASSARRAFADGRRAAGGEQDDDVGNAEEEP